MASSSTPNIPAIAVKSKYPQTKSQCNPNYPKDTCQEELHLQHLSPQACSPAVTDSGRPSTHGLKHQSHPKGKSKEMPCKVHEPGSLKPQASMPAGR